MKIAVAGATGTIGTKICTELEKRGHQVVPLSRSTGVDASVLESLTPALAGVDVVIDVLNHTVLFRQHSDKLKLYRIARRIFHVPVIYLHDPCIG